MPGGPIILFDGVCNFCNNAVNFVIKRDKKNSLRFATLQSEVSHQILRNKKIEADDLSSFVFIENEKIFTRSTAALRVCRYLTGMWPLMYGFMIVPKFIRDGVYNWVSGNRYKWFGKKEKCMVPTPQISAKFLKELL